MTKSKKTNDVSSEIKLDKKYLNQILFGVPGTGKTYRAVELALNRVGFSTEGLSRTAQKAEFDRRVEAGQIGFVTFHQSMSYEDFVEGIKPRTHDGRIEYGIENGIFKQICERAQQAVDFEEAYAEFQRTPIPKFKNLTITEISDNGIRYKPNKILVKDHISRFLQSGERLDDSTVLEQIVEHLAEKHNLGQKKPHVLIIDEINRGNLAQIFGELITLIEPNKRLGEIESLKVVLPYSKTLFGVPNKISLIGTMNTADRSVEQLDTALRRRFQFLECPPQYHELPVIENLDLGQILKTINDRMEQILDKDHRIGHTYFLGIETLEDLKFVFQHQILPLLQEYFFGDYGKIGLILGGGFVERKTAVRTAFATFDYGETLPTRDLFALRDWANIDLKSALEDLI